MQYTHQGRIWQYVSKQADIRAAGCSVLAQHLQQMWLVPKRTSHAVSQIWCRVPLSYFLTTQAGAQAPSYHTWLKL